MVQCIFFSRFVYTSISLYPYDTFTLKHVWTKFLTILQTQTCCYSSRPVFPTIWKDWCRIIQNFILSIVPTHINTLKSPWSVFVLLQVTQVHYSWIEQNWIWKDGDFYIFFGRHGIGKIGSHCARPRTSLVTYVYYHNVAIASCNNLVLFMLSLFPPIDVVSVIIIFSGFLFWER